ncbi:MAG: hypothetical protein ABJG88_10035 [Litorimonas sp.]
MGFKIACAAVPIEQAEDVIQKLDLKMTSQEDEYNECDYSGGEVANGYFVIWKNTNDIDFTKKERAVFDNLNDCFIMAVSETVMSGFVCKVSDSKIDWQITYIGCESEIELETKGVIPEHILELYETLEKKKTDEGGDETYEILSLTFQHYTGHKYDHEHDFKFSELQVLKGRKSWWEFWK